MPENLNQRRYNNRVNGRLDTRLSLRIERFRVGQDADALASFRVKQDSQPGAQPPAPSAQPVDIDQPN